MKKVTVNASRVYDIIIDKGILDRAGELCATVKKPCRAAILTDSNVAPLYLEKVENSMRAAGFITASCVLPAGEETKCLNMLGKLYDELTAMQWGKTEDDMGWIVRVD